MSENKTMFIRQKIVLKRFKMKSKEQAIKFHAKAQRIALAVVIAEFLLAGSYWGLIKYDILPLGEKIVVYNTNVAEAHTMGPKTQILEPEEVIEWDGTAEMSAYTSRIAEVTAYSEIDSCHHKNCAMASGKRAYVGAVACPREIKLGTMVIIDNKPYICEDRTALTYNGRFDIFMGYGEDSYQKAKKYGIHEKDVKILEGT